MKKFAIASVMLALATLTTVTASAAGGPFGRWRSYSYQPAPAFAQPGYQAYSYQPAPAIGTQPGYRSFSYQPGIEVTGAAPTYRAFSYQPAPSPAYMPRAMYGGRYSGRSFENGINKSLGRVN